MKISYRYLIYKNPKGPTFRKTTFQDASGGGLDDMFAPDKRPVAKPTLKTHTEKIKKILKLLTTSRKVAKNFLKNQIKGGHIEGFSNSDNDSKQKSIRQYLKSHYKQKNGLPLSEKQIAKYTRLVMKALRRGGQKLTTEAGQEVDAENNKPTNSKESGGSGFVERDFKSVRSSKELKYMKRVTSAFFEEIAKILLKGRMITTKDEAKSITTRLNQKLHTYGVNIIVTLKSSGKGINYSLSFDGPKAWRNVSVYSKRRERRVLSKVKRRKILKDLKNFV